MSNVSLKDIVCIFPYVPCASSPFYNNQEIKNGITMLERCIYDIKSNYPNCSFLVMGDLNSRISNIQPITECNIATRYLEDVNTSTFFTYNNTVHDRCSQDIVVNTFGRSLIEMCAALNFIVLNGFCVGDTEGAYTFTSPNGDSVIDYCLVSDDLLMNDLNMTVHSRVDSWHMPISLTLKIDKNPNIDNLTAVSYDKFIWNSELVERFDNYWIHNDVQQNVTDTTLILNMNIDLSGECIGAFSELLLNCAHMMRKSIVFNPTKPKRIITWFDKTCYDKKRIVRKSLHKYAKSRCPNTKATYVQLRREYKSLLNTKRLSYCRDKTTFLMTNLNNSRVFWKEIRSVCIKPRVRCDIDITQWYRYFKDVFQIPSTPPPICKEQIIPSTASNSALPHILNSPITYEEVRTAVQRSQPKKAVGPDMISNELLKHIFPKCSDFIVQAFNNIFNCHILPYDWTTANIIPIHKKGDTNLCSNYRPIWLTSLFSKMYTRILDKRIGDFLCANNILPEEQAGFREGYSTTDHIFTLYAMIQKQFSKTKGRKLYVCFVDYRQAFDSVNREALFKILENNGISGNCLLAIKSIYKSVLAAVKIDGNLSEFFECPTGLKQGCQLSPKLFSIFMTELSKALNKYGSNGIQFLPNMDPIFHLLFADDLVIVSDTIIGLQNQLDILNTQSQRLGLVINDSKTKIIVFRKGGFLAKSEKWHFGDRELSVVNVYKYLGLDFTTRLSFNNATSSFIAKAKQSCYEITKSLNYLNCYNMNVFMKLFDSKVQPVLSYACELWGMNEIPEIERVHTSCLKRFLNVSTHCSNVTLYAETGRYPLSITFKIRCVKYWFRLLKLQNTRICRQAYEMLLVLSENGSTNWVSDIKHLLCSNGFGIVWLCNGVGNEKQFLSALKLRLVDCFKQSWDEKMRNSEHFKTFYSYKSLISPELYLNDDSFGRKYRNILSKFRLGVSQIHGHRYRFYKHNKLLLKCPLCENPIEDEYHVIFVCYNYTDLRKSILPKNVINIRSIHSLNTIMTDYHRNLAKYLLFMFERRNEIMLQREKEREND